MQSQHSGYSLVETPETVDGCSLVPLICVRVSCCFCIANQGAPFGHIFHIEFLALHTLEYSLVQFGAPQ